MTGVSEVPQISIVTINFNQGRFLQEAIDSVASNDDVSWEHIIVDPGSTDCSADIYDQLDGDARYRILRQSDRGPADGLNIGLDAARGGFFGYINADDYYLSNSLAGVLREFVRQSEVSAIVGHGLQVDESGRYVRRLYSDKFTARRYLTGAAVAVQQSTFFRTAALKSVGGFNVENKVSWDGEALLDVVRAGGDVSIVNRTWGAFRVYDASITGSQRLHLLAQSNRSRLFAREFGRPAGFQDAMLGRYFRATRDLRCPSRAISRLLGRRATGRASTTVTQT